MLSASPRLLAAAELAPDDLHAAFGAAFADYLIGPFSLPPAAWPGFLARQGVDLGLSRAALDGAGRILAFCLVAPRPALGRWRLATMGALPAARGSGAAPALLDDFIARAAAAGQGAVELEVFAQNERALRLYQGRGFAPRHELHGYLAESGCLSPAAAPAGLREVDTEAARAWLTAAEQRIADLPLQVGPAALSAASTSTAWQLDGAQLLFAQPDALSLSVLSLIDESPRQAAATALLQALRARYPEASLRVPQIQRLDLGGAALRALGCAVLPLHQLLLLRPC
jgi:ribosomal protein S18 acetylase RimI-like enzyme